VIRERLHEYDSQTLPILSFFKGAGVAMFEIKGGEETPQRILERIREALAGMSREAKTEKLSGAPQVSVRS
jgi:adenylate kinase family enzyme